MGESCYILKMAVQDAFVINGADQSKMGCLLLYLPVGLLMEINCRPFVICFYALSRCVKEIHGVLLKANFECNICVTQTKMPYNAKSYLLCITGTVLKQGSESLNSRVVLIHAK